jgi:transcriptional regulator of acetoin/glycerol metabolism
MLETRPEPGQKRERTVRALVYVLSYDDLLDVRTQRFELSRVKWPLQIRRSTDESPVSLHESTQLRIPDPFMSGEHAVVDRRGTSLVVRDADSRNGTWVNGARVTEHRLADGDLIEIGHSLLCYRELNEMLVDALDAVGDAPCLGPTRTHCGEVAALGVALEKIGPSSEPVLVLAETGSGKEVAAAAVHALSGRTGEFRAVDCGAIPENLFESTFFGHKKGAFTGAEESRVGEIVRADGGTLFLDEVGNMTASAQAKLLRTIETGEVTAVGGTKPQKVDVRWVAATNRDLFSDSGGFREDLLRRLAGYTARIPALRRRREDLGILTSYLLRDANVAKAVIAPGAARALFCDPFTGNIRQLRATLRSATLLAGDETIDLSHLPEQARSADAPKQPTPTPTPPSRKSPRATPEADEVASALRETKGNVVRAAEQLGTHARQVYRWIERYGLELDDYRDD